MRKLNSVFRLGYYLLIKTVVLPLTERVYFFFISTWLKAMRQSALYQNQLFQCWARLMYLGESPFENIHELKLCNRRDSYESLAWSFENIILYLINSF